MTQFQRSEVLAIAALLLAGCGATEGGPSDAGALTDAGSSDAGSCPEGTHRADQGCEASLAGWTPISSLAQRRDHHSTFVADVPGGTFLYVLGGVVDSSTLLGSTEQSRILENGSLEAAQPARSLPALEAGGAVARAGARVVMTGGFRQGGLSANVDVTRVEGDGSLAAWTAGPAMATRHFHHAAVALGDTVWVLGGMTGDNTDNTPMVERARFDGTGALGAWAQDTPLPAKRSHHAAVVSGGFVYVLGGLRGNPSGTPEILSDILRAPIDEDGIGAWEGIGALPNAVATHAAFEHRGHLYVVGGISAAGTATAEVWRARVEADGALGPWEEAASLPAARAHAHSAVVHGRFVYLAGGAQNHVSNAEIFVGAFE